MEMKIENLKAAVDAVMRERKSVRAFLPNEVSRELIEDLLEISARAPSGNNAQPWKVYVVTGAKKDALGQEILKTFLDPEESKKHEIEYDYYPKKWIDPFAARRKKVGLDLYALLGLGKGDQEGMMKQVGRNFTFFDAPVALFFTINRMMNQGSWLDYGMFLQNVMLAAKARGLDTCPQAAFIQFHKIISNHLNIPDDEQFVCAISLGYEDTSKIENTLISERAPVSEFTKFID
jgi:nitroreductase